MKLRKMILSAMAATMLVSSLALPASASSADTDFMIHIPGSGVAFDVHSWRIKDDPSSSYVRYDSGPSSFIGIVYGGPYQSDVITDCTSYEYYSGAPRDPAVIRVGQKGYIRQDVYETYGDRPMGAAAKLAGKYNGEGGTASGAWSPDSVYESGCIYFN